MSSMTENHGSGAFAPDMGAADLAQMRAAVQKAAESGPDDLSPADLIDRASQIEALKNSLDALQASTIRAFARVRAATHTATGQVDPEKLDRDIASQIGLACRVSPTEGRKRVRTARDLHDGLDRLRGQFVAGEMSAYKVSTVVTATSHLDAEERSEVDRLLATHDVARLGVGSLRDLARMLAAQVAPEKFRTRCAAARTGRRVTLRPSADGMTDLVAHLPVEQGAACYAALQKAFVDAQVNPAPLTRGRGQVMADTLVERVTGQATAEDVRMEVQVVVPVEALVDPGSPLPAEIPGLGAVPVEVIGRGRGRKTWRRLITRKGIVIGGDSRKRKFTKFLTMLIRARDRYRCREPYCDAPIRHLDHVVRWSDGGLSGFDDGRGTCEFHNYSREYPGWNVENTPDGICTTTPTGHRYVSPTPRGPATQCGQNV